MDNQMTNKQTYGFHFETRRSMFNGTNYVVRVTDMPKPAEADLSGYCYRDEKWTWIVGYWCAECGDKLFFG